MAMDPVLSQVRQLTHRALGTVPGAASPHQLEDASPSGHPVHSRWPLFTCRTVRYLDVRVDWSFGSSASSEPAGRKSPDRTGQHT